MMILTRTMVYDEGLHRPKDPKGKEPGYLKGMERGGQLMTQTLLQPVTVPFYKLLHKTCWSNYEGEGSYMKSVEAGNFRRDYVNWAPYAGYFFPVCIYDEEAIDNAFPTGSREEIMAQVKQSDPEFLELLQEKLDALMEEIEQMNRLLGLPVGKSIVALKNYYSVVMIVSEKDLDLEALATKLFEHYEKALELAPTLFEKIECILFHYTMCEHIHFFRDGQGPTDRMLFLTGQLCRVGSNPALLDYPFRACTWPFAHALTHLLKGIHEWQEECARIHGLLEAPTKCAAPSETAKQSANRTQVGFLFSFTFI